MKHGWKNNNRIKLVVICVLVTALCAGYIIYTPKLINAPLPFIELAGTVGTAVGNAKYVSEHPSPTPTGNNPLRPTPTPVPTPRLTPTPVPTPVPDNKLTIRVEDTYIYINKILCTDTGDFSRRFNNMLKDDSTITLIDDYAELKTFRGVIKVFKQLGVTDYAVDRVDD